MPAMHDEIGYASATDLAARIRAKRISSAEVTQAILARIEALEPRINAFVMVDGERAMATARAADARVAQGGELPPLLGVPVTIKDLYWTVDQPTRSGSHTAGVFQAPFDAPLVGRLKAAGAVVLGKTTTPEFGWKGVSESPLTGITHNPWRHGYNAGASSAGAGAAAAAGYGPLHQGGDGAGSVRMPAHFCGVFGLKTSYGRIAQHPVPTGDYSSGPGPMTRTVADAALMLRIMAGPSFLDHTASEAQPMDYPALLTTSMRGKRIAWSPDLGHARVDPEVAALTRAAAMRFADMGAIVEEVTPDWGTTGPELIRFFWAAHLSSNIEKFPQWEAKMDPGLVACAKEGARITVAEYQAARARKHAYITAIHRFMEGYDFLLTPAVSVAAFPADKLQPAHWPQHPWDWIMWAEFSYPFNHAGNPAASVPCGFTADGLPVGLQIVGRRHDDLGVLQASAAFEAVAPWAQHRPNIG
jgi:aspartyl-tRNA(Asn)/glutamyl-tRNA(Gln) amidotransferase subunit A